MIEFIKKNKYMLIIFMLLVFSSFWLVTKGMPWQHDIEFHFSRLNALAHNLKNGDFIALIHDSFYGYGYANGIFYGNFYFYPFAFLSYLGLSNIHSLKIFYIAINLFTLLNTFYVSNKISKNKKISLIITIMYLFSNYRLFDVFTRGAVGEMLAFMVIPTVIYGLYNIVYDDYKKWYYFTIGFVLLLLSHLISTFLVAAFCVIIIVFNIKKLLREKQRIFYLIISGFVGLLFGAFFLFPIIEQYLKTEMNIFKVGSVFHTINSVLTVKDFFLSYRPDSLQLGYGLLLMLPLRFFIKKDKVLNDHKKLLSFADSLFVCGFISLFLIYFKPFWKLFGEKLDFIQFPWRLFTISTIFFVFSLLIYFVILENSKFNRKVLRLCYLFVILVSLFNNMFFSIKCGFRRINFENFSINEIGTAEYLPYETNIDLIKKGGYSYRTNNKSMIVNYSKKGLKVNIKYSNNLNDDTYIEVPLINYLGYKADGAKIINGYNNLIRLVDLDESGEISVYYGGTNTQKISYFVSFVSVGLFLGYVLIKKVKNK